MQFWEATYKTCIIYPNEIPESTIASSEMFEMCSFRWELDSCEIRGELPVNKIELLLSRLLLLNTGKMSFLKLKLKKNKKLSPVLLNVPFCTVKSLW